MMCSMEAMLCPVMALISCGVQPASENPEGSSWAWRQIAATSIMGINTAYFRNVLRDRDSFMAGRRSKGFAGNDAGCADAFGIGLGRGDGSSPFLGNLDLQGAETASEGNDRRSGCEHMFCGLIGMQDAPLIGDDDHTDDDAVENAAEGVKQIGTNLFIEGAGLSPNAVRLARGSARSTLT